MDCDPDSNPDSGPGAHVNVAKLHKSSSVACYQVVLPVGGRVYSSD